MQKYLVMTMCKRTKEVRTGYVCDVSAHGNNIEEYVDGIIDEVGSVLWAVFEPGIKLSLAQDAFATYASRTLSMR